MITDIPYISKLTKNKLTKYEYTYVLCGSQGIIFLSAIIILLISNTKFNYSTLLLFIDPILLLLCLIWFYLKENMKPLIILVAYEILTVIYDFYKIFNVKNIQKSNMVLNICIGISIIFVLCKDIVQINKNNEIVKTKLNKEVNNYSVKKNSIALYIIIALLIISQIFLFYQNYNYNIKLEYYQNEIINLNSTENKDIINSSTQINNVESKLDTIKTDTDVLKQKMNHIYDVLNIPSWLY